jgi:hypothetical protein
VYQRADGRCEYCLLHQEDTPFRHTIDHIIALKHGGETIAENLALACMHCNVAKGSDIGSLDMPGGELVRLYHPHRDRWRDHFAIEGSAIVGLTAIGRATVRLLGMNVQARLDERRRLQAVDRYPVESLADE